MRQPRAWVQRDPRTKDKHPRDQRWRVIYEDPNKNYQRRTKGGFPSKAKADEWFTEFKADNVTGRWIDPQHGKATFRAVAQQWYDCQHFDKANTANGYRRIIEGSRSLLNVRFGDVPIGDITHEAVQAWVKDMAGKRSTSTVRNHFYLLRQVLDFAVQNDRLVKNPASTIRPPSAKPVRNFRDEWQPLSDADVDAVIANLPRPWDTYTLLVARTGMRPEEVVGLRLKDVDLDEGVLHVRTVLVDLGVEQRREKPKTDLSRREIELDDDTWATLRTYVTEHCARAQAFFAAHPEHADPGDDLPLFVGVTPLGKGHHRKTAKPDIERLDFSTPARHKVFYAAHWKAALKAAGLPGNTRFYDLRHLHITAHVDRLGQPGALTLKEIQERVGHSTAVMTFDRYSHTSKVRRQQRRAALNAVQAQPTDA
jgi:integrase